MPVSRNYASAGAFRQALEQRLKSISQHEGTDFQRLCRQVAFDRFLARVMGNPTRDWVLKGGYAMELRFATARSTRDLDFTLRAGETEFALDHLQRSAAIDARDFFNFRVGEAMMDLEAAPYGGARFPVETRIDGRIFVRFHADVGIGDVILDPLESMITRDWLDFAGIPSPSVQLISREQHFAEKIHAYTLPRTNPNSRVRDLVDLYLLITAGSLNAEKCIEPLHRTFERRGTHDIPKDLTPPPSEWDRPFRVLAEECQISIGFREAFDELVRFWKLYRKVID